MADVAFVVGVVSAMALGMVAARYWGRGSGALTALGVNVLTFMASAWLLIPPHNAAVRAHGGGFVSTNWVLYAPILGILGLLFTPVVVFFIARRDERPAGEPGLPLPQS